MKKGETIESIESRYLLTYLMEWNDASVPDELRGLLRSAEGSSTGWKSIIEAHLQALDHQGRKAIERLQTVPESDATYFAARLLAMRIWIAELENPSESLKIADTIEKIVHKRSHDNSFFVLLVKHFKGNAFFNAKQYSEAIGCCDSVLSRSDTSNEIILKILTAKSTCNKGVALGGLERFAEALKAYEEVIERFGTAEELSLREQVARAMVNKGVTLGQLKKPEEELKAYEEVIEQFGEAKDLPLREQVAMAMVNKGITLGQLKKPEEALTAYEEVIERFGEAKDLPLRELVAMAMVNKGITLGQLKKPEEALKAFEEVIDRFCEAAEMPIRELVLIAMFNKGVTLGQLRKPEEELKAYENIIERFGKAEELPLREWVAIAMVGKGATLEELNKTEEALKGYEEVIERFGEAEEMPLRQQVANALFNKGVVLGQFKKPEEALRAYEEVIERFGKAEEMPLRERVANAMFNKGVVLGQLKKPEEALKAFEKTIEEFGNANDQELLVQLARSILNKALVLIEMDRREDSLRTLEQLQERFRENEGSDIARLIELSKQFHEAFKNNEFPKLFKNNPEAYLNAALNKISEEDRNQYYEQITNTKNHTDVFLSEKSHFADSSSFLLVLREWNSYTPIMPTNEESDRGGGYYIRHDGQGIVIDPGYDFISNFHTAGGRMCDIDHIILTHAHDDHTAEFEALLMLLNRFNKQLKKQNEDAKSVCLYLSIGAERKFSGLLNLKDNYVKRIFILAANEDCKQTITIGQSITLTPLAAYHNDVMTKDTAVGLGFEFVFPSTKRTVVFTSDTGLHPRKYDSDGKPEYHEGLDHIPKVDTEKQAVHELYPKLFEKPDLLVAHIGAIVNHEFQLAKEINPDELKIPMYYDNHLGVMGVLTLIGELDPKIAIISEFGSELKNFYIKLTMGIESALKMCLTEKGKDIQAMPMVIPGGLTIAYDIKNHQMLCHDTAKFEPPEDLVCRGRRGYKEKYDNGSDTVLADPFPAKTIPYLFQKKRKDSTKSLEMADNKHAMEYFRLFYNLKLPFHKGLE